MRVIINVDGASAGLQLANARHEALAFFNPVFVIPKTGLSRRFPVIWRHFVLWAHVSMSEDEQQRSPRVRTALSAVLVDSDGGELPVEITDLSSGGFRLRAGETLVVGERVRLRVTRYGDFPAQILWVEGNDAGGRFLEPVLL